MTRVYACTIVELPVVNNRKGNISIVENGKCLQFDTERIFFIYDIPAGKDRGGHAHKSCHQFIVAASGSFEVEVFDGNSKRTFILDRPFYGLHIPPGIWASQKNFSSGAVCLVLASEKYLEEDYIRDLEKYMDYINGV